MIRHTARATPLVPYLALLPMGLAVPPRLRLERWALTPPFHPCRLRLATGGLFSVALSVGASRDATARMHPALEVRVMRHRALWSSDFPPPVRAGSEPPPSRSVIKVPETRRWCKQGCDLCGGKSSLLIARSEHV